MKYPHQAQEEVPRLLSGPPEKEIGKIQRTVPILIGPSIEEVPHYTPFAMSPTLAGY